MFNKILKIFLSVKILVILSVLVVPLFLGFKIDKFLSKKSDSKPIDTNQKSVDVAVDAADTANELKCVSNENQEDNEFLYIGCNGFF